MTSKGQEGAPTAKLRLDPDTAPRVHVYWDGGFTEVPLPAGVQLTLGRGKECDVSVADESVSRRHAELSSGPPVRITDLGSANGTRINGIALAPLTPAAVGPGALVELGDAVLVIRASGAEKDSGSSLDDSPQSFGPRELVERLARVSVPVLFTGGVGVGKGALARRLHSASPRSTGPLEEIRCGRVADAELELFGGGPWGEPGALERAHGGTLLLRDLERLPSRCQKRLAVVLDQGGIPRDGQLETLDVRILATTNCHADETDFVDTLDPALYHRIATVAVAVPLLRQRKQEIEALTLQVVADACAELGRPSPAVSPSLLAALQAYDFPGNLRELRDVMLATLLKCRGETLEVLHLPPQLRRASKARGIARVRLREELDEVEHRRIVEALATCNGNQTRAAKLLGVPRRTLVSRLKRHGISRPRQR